MTRILFGCFLVGFIAEAKDPLGRYINRGKFYCRNIHRRVFRSRRYVGLPMRKDWSFS